MDVLAVFCVKRRVADQSCEDTIGLSRDVHRVLEGQGLKSSKRGTFGQKIVKTADLQAHNASRCDALRACRSAIFRTQPSTLSYSGDAGI